LIANELVPESDPDKAEPSAAFSDLFNTSSDEGSGKKRPDLFKLIPDSVRPNIEAGGMHDNRRGSG
jgi:hypothetical protein